MGDPRHHLGFACEDAAAAWLARAGWRILARRQRSPAGGEVDLVAIDPAGILVAVEVRGRRSARAGSAVESVDERRIGRLRRTLASFARSSHEPSRGLRVDLVAVAPVPGAPGRWRLTRVPGVG
jgi:putative endonuclease